MKIGLTGQIGAGKTTAARILRSLGAAVVDADAIGHQVVRHSAALRRKLGAAFGRDIFDINGRLLRKKLAGRAFVNPHRKQTLDALVHPYLLRELRRQVRHASRFGHVVIDAALLLDWDMDREVDCVLVIHAGRDLRLKRLQERGLESSDARARLKSQSPFSVYRRRSDRVILNNGSPADLRRKLAVFWNRVTAETD